MLLLMDLCLAHHAPMIMDFGSTQLAVGDVAENASTADDDDVMTGFKVN